MKNKLNLICKITLILLFIIYLFILLYVTLLNRTSIPADSIWEYARWRMNLIPGESIMRYLKLLKNGDLRFISILNLGVNLLLLTPMAIFLMSLFKIMRKWYVLFPTCFLTLIIIEILQLITMRGSFDVDDLILNMASALIGFAIWKILFCLKKNKERKENV